MLNTIKVFLKQFQNIKGELMIDITRNDILTNKDMKVVVLGAGAVGSFIVDHLVALGLTNVTVYDDDIVESHNITNQRYGNISIGKPKATELMEIIYATYGVKINAFVNTEDEVNEADVIFNCTDSYKGRTEVKLSLDNGCKKLYFETGMGVNHWEVIFCEGCMYDTITRPTLEEYETPLEGEPTSPCGSRLTLLSTVHQLVGGCIALFIEKSNLYHNTCDECYGAGLPEKHLFGNGSNIKVQAGEL
jgi:hypothetical protein